MFEADRDKLIKILRMFGSSHDGEVASAARRAHELLKGRSLDWDDLIIRIHSNSSGSSYSTGSSSHYKKPEPEPEPRTDDEADLIHRCAERSKCLTAWENEFIESISESIIEWGHLTQKQRNVLDRIINKLKVRGVWDDI